MRVALISHNARSGDAIGNQVAARAAFFRDRGAEVHVFVESDSYLHPDLCRIARAVSPHADLAALAGELRHCDLLIVEYGQFYSLLELLPQVAGKGPRILIDYHGVTPPHLWDGPAEALRQGRWHRGMVWYADQAVVHSQFLRRELCAATGYPMDRVHLLPLWYDPARFATSPRQGRLRRKLQLTNERIMLFVGRLAANKRVPTLIEALSLLKDDAPAVHAVVIGDHGDRYRRQLDLCRETADRHGLSERVHFLGHVCDDDLVDAYQCADVFVMPSLHEGCCIPALEAMAAGVPVIAARSSALPETVAGAGLTFTPDDPADLAAQIRRVLPQADKNAGKFERDASSSDSSWPGLSLRSPGEQAKGNGASGLTGASKTQPRPPEIEPLIRRRGMESRPWQRIHDIGHAAPNGMGLRRRIAVIAPRFAESIVGGAERSLRLIAETLAEAGCGVEVFTTGKSDETINGVLIHRFPSDPVDEGQLAAATRALRQSGSVADSTLNDYLGQTRFSHRLLQEYAARRDEFDACLVGPYGTGLTCEVVRIKPERTLLVPCFHREPLASHPEFAALFGRVGGMLFHSDAERRFAEVELGIGNPNSVVIGTWLPEVLGNSQRGRQLVGSERTYLLYAGRFCHEKNLPLLLEWQKAYAGEHPNRYRFAFVGGGTVKLPESDDWKDLGFLDELEKADVMAGAAAVVQLSTNESLSLVALEAWQAGVPVIGHEKCEAIAEMIDACGGGFAVATCAQFCDALDQLWQNAEQRARMGNRGREFARQQFSSRDVFQKRIAQPLDGLDQPLAELMRERGRALTTDHWHQAFAERVESVLHAEPLVSRVAAMVTPRHGEVIRVRLGSVRAGVRLTNVGTTPLWPDGPHATRLRCRLLRTDAEFDRDAFTRLPRPLNPGESIPIAMRLPALHEPGDHRAFFTLATKEMDIAVGEIPMQVADRPQADSGMTDDAVLAELAARLTTAEPLAELPAGYADVSEGLLARWKQAVKRKLLHQFQAAYVDVLSRQQTAFNRQMLTALQELTECAAMLGAPAEATGTETSTDLTRIVGQLKRRIVRFSRRIEALEQRLEAVETDRPGSELHDAVDQDGEVGERDD